MKIYFAMFPGDKKQIKTMNKLGVKNRLISYHFLNKQLKDNRRKIVNRKVREMNPETRAKLLKKVGEEVLKEKNE
jgi:hypothetical protein